MRRIKRRAVHRNRTLEGEVEHLPEVRPAAETQPDTPRKTPRPVGLRGRRPLTVLDIESAIDAGRD
jgi:hypothetical protein